MNSKRTVLAAGAALAVVGSAAWLLMRGPKLPLAAPSQDAAHQGSDDAAPLAPAAGVDGKSLAATREADAAKGAAANPGDPASLAAPGKVHVKVSDARTQAALEHVRVRFLNETRFAEANGEHEITATLTSGSWEASVSAAGFEPVRLGPFDVKAGETLELGTIALGRGSGVVEGQVTARHLSSGQEVDVELWGEGRSPCDHCLALRAKADPGENDGATFGADCGYGDACDAKKLAGGGSFRFEHLAAGIYWLRAFESTQHLVDARRIEIDRGGRVWQDLDVSAPTVARFELRHDGGGLFTGAWSTVHDASPAAIHYDFRRHGRSVAGVDVMPTADDCLASVGPPIAIPGRAPPTASQDSQRRFVLSFVNVIQTEINSRISSGQFVVGQAVGQQDRDDRARTENDGALFDAGEPEFRDVALQAKAIRPDLHEVAPLPRSELSVVVSCGSYRSDETPVDLRVDPFEPFVIALKLDPDIAQRLPEIRKGPPASCAACHGSEAPTDGNVNYGSPRAEITLDMGDLSGGTFDLNDLSGVPTQITLPGLTPSDAPKSDEHH